MYMWRFVLITVHAISGEGFQFIFNNEQCTGCGVMITKETKKGHLRDAEDSTKAGTVQETVRGEEIVRASSVPLSVGAQILLHYLSSSADNSYSQRYVRSVFSLTSALMLLNMAHSHVGTGVDTCCCTVSSLPPFLSLSLPLFCPSVLLQVHSITSTSRLSFTYKAATQTLSPTSTGLAFVVSSNRRGSCCDLQSRKSCSATETPHSLLALTNVIINAVITETRKAKRSTLAMGKSSFLCTRCLLSDFFFSFCTNTSYSGQRWSLRMGLFCFGLLQDNLSATGQIIRACRTHWNIITSIGIVVGQAG